MTARERRQALRAGCRVMCDALGVETEAERRYVGGLADALEPRLNVAMEWGDLAGVFPG